MSGVGYENCIAMSEMGEWYAFPKTMTRGEVMHALAAEEGWWDAIHTYRVLSRWVRMDAERARSEGAEDWWAECAHDAEGAIAAWVVST